MLFNSLDFVVFFPAVVLAYFATPNRFRWALLLAASYFFYASWRVEYLLLIWASTLVDYWAALQMGRRQTRTARRPFLIGSLVANLGLLGAFKYFNFFSASVQEALARLNVFIDAPYLDVLLPVGISFYTFQTLSYSIDVYRGEREPERHLGFFALYVSFFPQLVAGPIERADRLIPQLRASQRFVYDDVSWGLCKIAYGFFKKLVVADRLAIFVNAVYANPEQATSWTALLAGVFFAFQIYCDFSGYSDIAIGTARIMGIRLSENFRRPYLAPSMRVLWQRWHITLTLWLRDYLFRPLRGRGRPSTRRQVVAVSIVFLAFGIWHGANWTFLICGLMAGAYVLLDQFTAVSRGRLWRKLEAWLAGTPAPGVRAASMLPVPDRERLLSMIHRFRYGIGVVLTFAQAVSIFIFFRAAHVGDALTLYEAIGRFDFGLNMMSFSRSLFAISAEVGFWPLYLNLMLGFLAIAILLLTYRLPMDLKIRRQTSFLVGMSILIMLLGTRATDQFIYFQF